MNRHKKALWAGVAALALLMAAATRAPAANATTGALTITSSTTLTEDHYGHIFIGADNVTFDCAGHSVISAGEDQGAGVGIAAFSRSGVVVRNCRVSGFVHGISLSSVTNFSVSNNTSTGNSGIGVLVMGAHGTVAENVAEENGGYGFGVNGGGQSYDIQFTSNTATDNGDGGFVAYLPYPLVHYETDISFTANISTGNGDDGGFAVSEGNDGVTLTGNTAEGNSGLGFSIYRADSATLDHNVATRNRIGGFGVNFSAGDMFTNNSANNNQGMVGNSPSGGGFYFFALSGSAVRNNVANSNITGGFGLDASSGNSFAHNTANNNHGSSYGFSLHQSPHNTFVGNVANNDAAGGFLLSTSSFNTLTRNVANGNGSIGFYANASTDTTLTGNVANNNSSFGFLLDLGSTANTVGGCVGHANGFDDAIDMNPPLANVWSGNNFGKTYPAGLD
jgi:parallel beta-helix repeat protein